VEEIAVDVGRVASLSIRALEPILRGDEMAFVMKFRDGYDPNLLWSAFESVLRQNLALQVALKPVGKSFAWMQIGLGDLNAALDRQRQRFTQFVSLEDLLSPAHAMTPDLPVRISQMGDKDVCFQISHALTNGRGALQWIDHWLAAANGDCVPPAPIAGQIACRAPRVGLALLPPYLLHYLTQAGLGHARKTVDLTHGKTPVPHDKGYASRMYSFSELETSRIIAGARFLEMSVHQYVCLAVAEAMLSAQPEKSRVSIAIPTDLARYSLDSPRTVPGNYTGGLAVQLRRGAPLQPQIARQFGWFRYGVDYWLPWILGAMSSNEQKLLKQLARSATVPVTRRGPFRNVSCAVSNIGDIKLPAICERIESGTGTTKTQTVFFTIGRLNGRFLANVAFARDLYDAEEVFRVADSAMERL
jgi:hypothetical protein